MRNEPLPIYQIQDFKALAQKEQYFYVSSLADHLQEHQFTREPHRHNFYIMLFVTQGSGTHTIDFTVYDVKPDTVFFMTPGQVHSWELSADADGCVIFFTQEFYANEYPHRMLFDFPYFNALRNKPILTLSQEDKTALMPVLHMLEQEFREAKLMRDVMLSRYLDVLLISLTRVFHLQEAASEVPGKDRMLLQNLERLIDLHYKEHAPVSFYADCLHVTAKHLNEVCKASLGRTTNELIQYRTLLEAKRLLVHVDLTSSQIASALGYFDNTYFFRFFKKHTGQTPEQFRAANKQSYAK
ncbi:helix-turn-helix domain-containing protein [Pontibacter akesuensis]|uniref:Transcriptional regulator, AraC family n=1 Tax=Pontibacter akesuensis TaxID=388950 RepID=A0A1I7FIT1_9BACT|nr:helix-turn-helix domain-containing protein [Pontibacter akesuensis]GHA61989.1 AraC family transcriptional regulator [Pontibacter akesuensis]SFU36081.1 transcriptional regulator, AraC family [Pontibacter akesuensis]